MFISNFRSSKNALNEGKFERRGLICTIARFVEKKLREVTPKVEYILAFVRSATKEDTRRMKKKGKIQAFQAYKKRRENVNVAQFKHARRFEEVTVTFF